ncbi:TetR/AcrR family transcriptional regulator [Solicola sp. PLA-1-18]|uniref:TetR/AcrR family transcriptional regulator n=1 Tax=Solicola sp. PLA-1-18 TaxID=3380532 RepID=UPI003B79D689
MARYDEQHKQATRERILATSGRRLKSDGVDGSGVATLMKDAGLTNGAFYAHFDSKDDLVAHVVRNELHSQLAGFSDLDPGADGLRQLVAGYLTVDHRDHPDLGCPSAALLDEIARGPHVVRQAYSDGILEIVDALTDRLPDAATASGRRGARARVLSAYALMAGTIQLARALTDDELASDVIAQGLADVIALLGLDRTRA